MRQSEQLGWGPERLRCERLVAPTAIGTARPTFSWRMPVGAGSEVQAAYQLVVATAPERVGPERAGPGADAWDSGWVESRAAQAGYAGRPLESREALFWSVRLCTVSGGTSSWSAPGRFGAGLLHRRDWSASWVVRPYGDRREDRAAYLVRRRFRSGPDPRRARAFVSALGVYELRVNATLVGDGLLRPGWTDYRRRAQYQAIDVTSAIRQGENVIEAVLAPGWYAGRIASQAAVDSTQPVPLPEFICQLELDYLDGRRVTIGTDESWEWRPSAILSSDLYDGEEWDRRLLPEGNAQVLPGRSAQAAEAPLWEPVECSRGTAAALVGERAEPVRVTSRTQAQVAWRADGSALVDSGRNDTGFLRLTVDEAHGQRVEVGYGEILDSAGQLYRDNLRTARCTDTFICAGGGPEELAPSFSFRGWRYAEVRGISAPERLLAAESVRIGTDMARTGWFSCSEPLVEQIYELMVCSLQSNYVEVPTDCPQRDERLGWMADALLFAPVAAYTYDIAPLMAKWCDDILDARTAGGGFTDIAPRPGARWPGRSLVAGAPAWADAGVQLPWLLYERYGATDVLEAMFPAMRDWLDLVHGQNPDGIWRHDRGNDFGDWVPAGPDTSHDLFSTCWLYRSSVVGARVAGTVGDAPAATWLAERAEIVKRAFLEEYVDAGTGRIADAAVAGTPPVPPSSNPGVVPETQTGYVMALAFDLLEGELAERAGQHLADLVVRAGRRLETGFCGSAYLLSALERAGHAGLAYDLLLRREPPSLGFMVEMGATSVWERWNGLDATGQPETPTMNSFNHYAMSSMLSWLIEGVGGLRPVPGVPALGEIRFAPALTRRLSEAAFGFEAPAGRLELRWAWQGDDRVVGQVHVPPGMSCAIASRVAVDEGPARAVDAQSGADDNGPGHDRCVGGGDHEVVWALS